MQKMVKRVSRVMKDSGDERIAFIPNEWGLIKLKYIVDCNKDVLRETTDHNYSFRYVDIGSVSLEKGIEKYERVSFGDSPSRARRIVHKGDVIVSTVRTYLKAIANIDDADNVIVSTGFAVLSPRIVDPLFLEYACKSHYFTENVTIESTGISYPAINSTKLLQLKIAVPSKEEQVIIGQILHDRIKEIDRVIEQTKLTIEDYKLLKQSIITEAVTKGLDKNVEMKDSGIEWVGRIPKHWEVVKIKHLFDVINERNENEGAILLSLFTALGVAPRSEMEDKGNKASTVINYKIVKKGDLIVNKLLAWMGAVAFSDYNGVTSPDYDVYRLKRNSNAFKQYYEWYFRFTNFKDDCYKYGRGIMMMRWRTYSSEFKMIDIVNPPYSEQVEIYEYLKLKVREIDALIEKKIDYYLNSKHIKNHSSMNMSLERKK